MKNEKKLLIIVFGILVFWGSGMIYAGKKAPHKVVGLAHSTLVKLGTNPII